MQGNKYKYSTFNELTSPGDYNFYGIIYDASFPLLEEQNNNNSYQVRYECTIKLIDKDVNCLTNQSNLNDNLINLNIKSSTKEAMPYIHSIGDIIRVHRGNYMHKKKRNVYLHLSSTKTTKSSWCIFAGAYDLETKETKPILCSHINYTFENQDEAKIKELRMFIKQHFTLPSSLFYPMESKLIQRVSEQDYDAVVQVVYKTELEDQMVYYVKDETDSCELHTFKYFNFIDVKDVIRIRGYKTEKNIIVMNQYSNILKIPQFTDYYKQFITKIAQRLEKTDNYNNEKTIFNIGNKDSNKRRADPEKIRKIEAPKFIYSRVIDYPNGIQVQHFDDVKEDVFIIEVNILNISPAPLYNFVNILCPNCNQTYFSPDVEFEKSNNVFTCSNCNSQVSGKFHYNIVLHCIENIYTNKIITLHLCSYDREGEDFFGLKPVDFYRDSSAFQILSDKTKKIIDKEVYVQVMVERIKINENNNYIYRIIGKYSCSL